MPIYELRTALDGFSWCTALRSHATLYSTIMSHVGSIDEVIPRGPKKLVSFNPHQCSFSSMFKVTLLPQGWTSIPITNPWHIETGFQVFAPSSVSSIFDQLSCPCKWKASPQHAATPTMFHCGRAVHSMIGFVPHTAFPMKLSFSLIWPENLLPCVCGVWRTPNIYFFIDLFFKQWLLFGSFYLIKPHPVECMAWSGSLPSLLNSLLVRTVSLVDSRLSWGLSGLSGLWWCRVLSVRLWWIKWRSVTRSGPGLLHNFASELFGELRGLQVTC